MRMNTVDLPRYVADGHDLPVDELESYGEPFTRRDGISFAAVKKTSDPQAIIIAYELPNKYVVTNMHNADEIVVLGEGSFERGILQAMKTYITQPLNTLETAEWPLELTSA